MGHGELVLLVEDERAAREALIAMLEARNYREVAAANGRQALEAYTRRGERISAVISKLPSSF